MSKNRKQNDVSNYDLTFKLLDESFKGLTQLNQFNNVFLRQQEGTIDENNFSRKRVTNHNKLWKTGCNEENCYLIESI